MDSSLVVPVCPKKPMESVTTVLVSFAGDRKLSLKKALFLVVSIWQWLAETGEGDKLLRPHWVAE